MCRWAVFVVFRLHAIEESSHWARSCVRGSDVQRSRRKPASQRKLNGQYILSLSAPWMVWLTKQKVSGASRFFACWLPLCFIEQQAYRQAPRLFVAQNLLKRNLIRFRNARWQERGITGSSLRTAQYTSPISTASIVFFARREIRNHPLARTVPRSGWSYSLQLREA